jgi:two-component sensor histidine kinase
VTIRWNLSRAQEGEVFSFSWEERGGPLVRTPSRKGYGQTILEDAARHLGTPVVSYERGGLRYRLDAPLQSIGRKPDMDRG